MVVKRTINALKQRPHDERRAFAGMCAIAVMVVVSGAWGISFFGNLRQIASQESYQNTPANTVATGQTAAAATPSLNTIVQSVISDLGAQAPTGISSQYGSTNPQTDASQSTDTLSQTPTSGDDVASQLQAALHQ